VEYGYRVYNFASTWRSAQSCLIIINMLLLLQLLVMMLKVQ